MSLGQSILNIIGAVARQFHKPQRNTWGQSLVDDRSQEEKLGYLLTIEPTSTDAGQTWEWAVRQLNWESPFGDVPQAASLKCVRRKSWPVRRTPANDPKGCEVWHIWIPSDLGYLCKGWGGQLGAALDPDDWVPVHGHRERDGTMYTPSPEDLAATDWELAFPARPET